MKKWLALSLGLVLATTGVTQASTVKLQPGPEGKDTWVWDQENYSHGSWAELRTNDTSTYDQYILIEFDLSSIPAPSPGMTTVVNSAELGLYRYDGYYSVPLTVDAHQITSSWVESVAWSGRPSFNPTVESSVTVTTNGWYEWDLTGLVQEWLDGTKSNYGVAVYNHGSGYFQRFVSSDNDGGPVPHGPTPPKDPEYRPYLEIEYSEAPPYIIPEPLTMLAVLLGTTGLAGYCRRRFV